jgi:hypothetical protein
MDQYFEHNDGFENFPLTWKMEEIKLPLKFPWKYQEINATKSNFIIVLGDGK